MPKKSARQTKVKAQESMSSAESEMSRDQSPSPARATPSGQASDVGKDSGAEDMVTNTTANLPTTGELDPGSPDENKPLALHLGNKSPLSEKLPSRGHPERKRRASNDSSDSVITKTSEGGATDDMHGGKDDEDDNDDDEDEKITANYDPERLKAFNMFVRLFVDENLDRMVPISKQPKDKIQAILEACDRQFPEYHVRSRKRIRTYLKSCRRMRRSKEQNGWEPLRPTPPHLTSAAAEGILASACDNESQNAKRMRMGLDPLPASAMPNNTIIPSSQSQQPSQPARQTTTPSSIQSQPAQVDRHVPTNDFLRHQIPPPAFRPPPEFHPPFFANGNGLFRPGFPNYQHPAHHHPPVIQHPLQTNSVQNGEFGPTDLSMKKSSSKNQLSANEVATIKQLIAGYRESAAFLYRSADELEQLLLQQN
ncbi:nucleolar protein 4-like isoform X2 [Gigantopelta aegis]|uniref:nucleolar protein 4-like isoform X2 n=1 Tax=Gigantopelta aegis TaxID=1735272 RepID=UPI001B88D91D|nr:nucleolar protein 4-like isoform X2 [Gigantopelta aegis]